MLRSQMPRPQYHEMIDLFRDLTSTKYCSHPVRSECKGPIVRAHTIPKRGSLQRIARNGHVYGFRADLAVLKHTRGEIAMQSIGINDASTFTGFCSRHDNKVFEPIERFAFEAIPQHAFLLAYRAICRELFAKEHHVAALEELRAFDRGLSVKQQLLFQDFLLSSRAGAQAAVSHLTAYKRSLDEMLVSETYDGMKFYIVLLDQTPEILAAGSIYVEFDFEGQKLQPFDINPLGAFDTITFSVIATETGGAVVFSWLGEKFGASSRFIRSLDNVSKDRFGDAIVRFVFTYCENTFLAPDWWDALPEENRADIRRRVQLGTHFTNLPTPDCLVDRGLRFVHWRNLQVASNLSSLSPDNPPRL